MKILAVLSIGIPVIWDYKNIQLERNYNKLNHFDLREYYKTSSNFWHISKKLITIHMNFKYRNLLACTTANDVKVIYCLSLCLIWTTIP